MRPSRFKIFTIVAIVIAIAGGFYMVKRPLQTRAIWADELPAYLARINHE